MDAAKKKDKKKKSKKAKNNIDFVIMTSEGDVKEVVRKPKKAKKAKAEAAAAEPEKRPRDGASADDKAAKKARKAERKAQKAAAAAAAAGPAAEAPEAPAPARVMSAVPDNPSGVTRLFVGNLPWAITDEGLAEALGVGALTAVKYITDKESGKFYGSAFVDVGDAALAGAAVKRAGSLVGGRKVKISFAPPRPGDVWPPVAGDSAARKKTVATDADVEALFAPVAPDGLRAVRWVTHKDSGEFKGCGYLSFYAPDQADAAMESLDGADLCGRKIRLDYTS